MTENLELKCNVTLGTYERGIELLGLKLSDVEKDIFGAIELIPALTSRQMQAFLDCVLAPGHGYNIADHFTPKGAEQFIGSVAGFFLFSAQSACTAREKQLTNSIRNMASQEVIHLTPATDTVSAGNLAD